MEPAPDRNWAVLSDLIASQTRSHAQQPGSVDRASSYPHEGLPMHLGNYPGTTTDWQPISWEGGGGWLILYVVAILNSSNQHFELQVRDVEGRTWPAGEMMIDEESTVRYACMAMVPALGNLEFRLARSFGGSFDVTIIGVL